MNQAHAPAATPPVNPLAPKNLNPTNLINWIIPPAYAMRFVTDQSGRLLVEFAPGREQEIYDHLLQHLDFHKQQTELKTKADMAERKRNAEQQSAKMQREAQFGTPQQPAAQSEAHPQQFSARYDGPEQTSGRTGQITTPDPNNPSAPTQPNQTNPNAPAAVILPQNMANQQGGQPSQQTAQAAQPQQNQNPQSMQGVGGSTNQTPDAQNPKQ